MLLVVFALWAGVLAGCGPQQGNDDEDQTAEAVRIAQEFAQSGDLGRARSELETLPVANATQWLVLLTEERVNTQAGAPETTALVRLTLALGVQSRPALDYAAQVGLLSAVAAPPTPTMAPLLAAVPVVEAQPAPSQAAPSQAAPNVAVIEATLAPAAEAPAADAATATPTPAAPTETPISKPQVVASNSLNVRGGPGTAYPIAGALNTGEQAEIIGKNPAGDWWQVATAAGLQGWVLGTLVQTSGDTAAVAVAANIPDAPPTPTPAPVAVAPEPAPAEPAPAAPAAPPPGSGNDFQVVERRLWDVFETGGRLDGPTVVCGEKRELHVVVLDANGSRLNGVAVQAIYGAQEIYVTGAQGKGDGQVEYVLGEGQGVRVVRDADGREVTSDTVDGMTTKSWDIPHDVLMGAKYCTDTASCERFLYSAGCYGHHSWTVTFKRRY